MGILNNKVLDFQGNKYINLENWCKNDINKIDNNLFNYEILEKLSENKGANLVTKVRSLNNNKIYSMKQFKNCSENPFIIQTLNILKTLNHPNIIKYYDFFKEENDLYLIMEYIYNLDIQSYIEAHNLIYKLIPEVEIWNILLQCLSALEYISKINNNFNSQIKLKLIDMLINNEQNIKIGVFSEQMYNNPTDLNYYERQSLNFLCNIFYKMINPPINQSQNFVNSNNIQANNIYSIELQNIIFNIYNIANNNNAQKIDITNIFDFVKNEYSKKYNKNTSIKAILENLYSYEFLIKRFDKKRTLIESNINKYQNIFWFLKTKDALSKNDIQNFNICIDELRRNMALSYSKLVEDKELDPLLVLTFILERIHQESNNNKINNENVNNNGKGNIEDTDDIDIGSNFNVEEDRTNQALMLDKFVTYFNSTMNSPITDLFMSFKKTKRKCKTCNSVYFNFSNCLYILFDLEKNNNSDFDLIKDGFEAQHNNKNIIDENENIICERCFTYGKFEEKSTYYFLNRHLVICFKRGNNYENQTKIIFENNINLKKYVEVSDNSPSNFYLIGSVNRICNNNEEQFVSRKPTENIQNLQQNEKIIMLFYNSKDGTS